MAIVGHLEQFEYFFERVKNKDALKVAFDYMEQALKAGSAINERILGLDCEFRKLGAQNLKTDGAYANRIEKSYDLGFGIRAIEQTYPLKSHDMAFFESHRKFVDFQLCVSGAEVFKIAYTRDLQVLQPYDEKKDLIVYENALLDSENAHIHTINFTAGTLGVFFPDDAHAGGLKFSESSGLDSEKLDSKSLNSRNLTSENSNSKNLNSEIRPLKVVLKIPLELL